MVTSPDFPAGIILTVSFLSKVKEIHALGAATDYE